MAIFVVCCCWLYWIAMTFLYDWWFCIGRGNDWLFLLLNSTHGFLVSVDNILFTESFKCLLESRIFCNNCFQNLIDVHIAIYILLDIFIGLAFSDRIFFVIKTQSLLWRILFLADWNFYIWLLNNISLNLLGSGL